MKMTFDRYMDLLTNPDKQFKFANGLTICEGCEDWSPKYTIANALKSSNDTEGFIAHVEHICEHMQFKIDTTDKANLSKYFQAHSKFANIDESYDNVDESMLVNTAETLNVEVSKRNGCLVFESINPLYISNFINATMSIDEKLGKALQKSLIEQDFDMKSKTSICLV